jgi:hypothetical protein
MFGTMSYLSVGVKVCIDPFSGEEESDASVCLSLPWLEINLGVENNPW